MAFGLLKWYLELVQIQVFSKRMENKVEEPDLTGTYTVQDYLKWSFEGFAELIRGKIWKMSAAPSSTHARVSRQLLREFYSVFPENQCEVFTAPFDVYLVAENQYGPNAQNVLQPDICVVCDTSRVEEKGCIGAPDLVVEILSPSTAKRDLNDKFSIYEEFGVKEYWVVFPGEQSITIFTLQEDKLEKWKVLGKDSELSSSIFPNLSFKMSDIFS